MLHQVNDNNLWYWNILIYLITMYNVGWYFDMIKYLSIIMLGYCFGLFLVMICLFRITNLWVVIMLDLTYRGLVIYEILVIYIVMCVYFLLISLIIKP